MRGANYRYITLTPGAEWPAHFGRDFAEDEFELRLLRAERLPPAALDAPIGSWVVARLQALGAGISEQEMWVDGGAFVWNAGVSTEDAPVGRLQVQCGVHWVAVFGDEVDAVGADVLDDFVTLLLRDPADVAVCEFRVVDPEWGIDAESLDDDVTDWEPDLGSLDPRPTAGTRNLYGWDGNRFLGAMNVWCSYASGRPRPTSFTAYHASLLAEDEQK